MTKEKDEKGEKLPRHVRVPHNVYVSVKETHSGSWNWSIKLRGKEIAMGTEDGEKDAWRALRGNMGLLVSVARKGAAKNATRQKLRAWCDRRPYLVSHVLSMLSNGMPEEEVVATAADEERALHDREEKTCGFAWPIPTHANSKPPAEGAAVIFSICKELGLEGRRAFAFGAKQFGMAFSDPDAEHHVHVTRQKREHEDE